MTALLSRADARSPHPAEARPLVAAGWLRQERPAMPAIHQRQRIAAGTPAPAHAPEHATVGGKGSVPRSTRLALRQVWDDAGRPYENVPARHIPRNLAVARAYLETDEILQVIAARHDISQSQVLTIARHVVYAALAACKAR
jgi:hypothetical protein